MTTRFRKTLCWGLVGFSAMLTVAAMGQDAAADATAAVVAAVEEPAVPSSAAMMWTLIAAFLVFFMQAGFLLVESGFVRAKNVCNIIMKNTMDFCIGALTFFLVGFGLMFGASSNGIFGTTLFGLGGAPEGIHSAWLYIFFVFQVVFAATAATIVSGAMAERTKFTGYIIYAAFICLVIYPVFGKWAWGNLLLGADAAGGWLGKMGFLDYAGSTVVHSVGGWAALAGAIVLGPRIGKFGRDGRPHAIPGHSMPMAALGTFILFFGWFGFNAGSSTDGANPVIGIICVNTLLSGAAGAFGAMIATWIFFTKPETGLTLNGILAGLVGITAGCDVMYPAMSIVVGLVAGLLVVCSVLFIERVLKIDDPVGAVSVHGVCGVWGTLALALPGFSSANASLVTQLIGVGAAFIWVFPTCLVLFLMLKAIGQLRVSEEEELAGLDVAEHGNEAYPRASWDGGGFDSMVPAHPAASHSGAPALSVQGSEPR